MILPALLALLLVLSQTPQATDDERNVFLDLGSEHCAESIAIAAYENTDAADLAAADAPDYVTFSAFEFESADRADAAMDELPMMVAETFTDDPDFSEREDLDEFVAEVPTEELGDRTIGYVMNLPRDSDELDVLFVSMLSIIKENQMVLILMFGESAGVAASPGLSGDAILPFSEMLDENWDGTGNIEDAIPAQDQMPIGWEGRDVTTVDLPTCDEQEQ
jgi:hypothetical protein